MCSAPNTLNWINHALEISHRYAQSTQHHTVASFVSRRAVGAAQIVYANEFLVHVLSLSRDAYKNRYISHPVYRMMRIFHSVRFWFDLNFSFFTFQFNNPYLNCVPTDYCGIIRILYDSTYTTNENIMFIDRKISNCYTSDMRISSSSFLSDEMLYTQFVEVVRDFAFAINIVCELFQNLVKKIFLRSGFSISNIRKFCISTTLLKSF